MTHVKIYGVPRSGTKALQYFCIRLLLEKNDTVHLQYEPFLWRSRKGGIHHSGLSILNKFGLFPKKDDVGLNALMTKHFSFKLNSYPLVEKYVWGNGYVDYFDGMRSSSINYIIVRDLFQVLDSLNRQVWNLFELEHITTGFKNVDFWGKYLSYLESCQLNMLDGFKQFAKTAKNDWSKNACIWYSTNLLLINKMHGNARFIDHSELTKSEEIIKSELKVSSQLGFKDLDVRELRNEESILNVNKCSKLEGLCNVLNKRKLEKYLLNTNCKIPNYFKTSFGDVVQKRNTETEDFAFQKKQGQNIDEKLENIPILKEMNDHINALI